MRTAKNERNPKNSISIATTYPGMRKLRMLIWIFWVKLYTANKTPEADISAAPAYRAMIKAILAGASCPVGFLICFIIKSLLPIPERYDFKKMSAGF